MKVIKNKRSGYTVSLCIEASQEELEAAMGPAFKRVAKHAKIQGFRPGKVTRSVFEKNYGKEPIIQEAMNDAVNKAYQEALKELTGLFHLCPVFKIGGGARSIEVLSCPSSTTTSTEELVTQVILGVEDSSFSLRRMMVTYYGSSVQATEAVSRLSARFPDCDIDLEEGSFVAAQYFGPEMLSIACIGPSD